jgi:hypothetical protein
LVDSYYAQRNTVPVGKLLEQHLKDAGFVDIKIISKDMDLGDWRGGQHRRHFEADLSVPETAPGARAAKWAFGDAMPFLIEHRFQDAIPEENKRRQFVKDVMEEYSKTSYHLYVTVYNLRQNKSDVQENCDRAQA